MAYIHRHHHRKRSIPSAESMYLLVVLAAAVATAWWAGHGLGLNLSAISTAAAVLGINERVGTTRPVGYSLAAAEHRSGSNAPYCGQGQVPAFDQGLAELKQRVGNVMGVPVECAHDASVVGDTVQQTSTGLAAYYKLTNTVTFTDGWRHWAITPSGFVTWEGSEPQPPG